MRTILLSLISVLFFLTAYAQDSIKISAPEIFRVETIDGIKFIGTFLNEDEQWMQFENRSLGTVSVLKSRIKKLNKIDPSRIRDGEYWAEDPSSSHYLAGPSAYCLHRGEWTYQNTYLFVNSFETGITENISFGGGTEIVSLVQKEIPVVCYLHAKFGYQVMPKLRMGGGLLYLHSGMSIGSGGGNSDHGIAFGLATAGNTDHHFTFGIGWDYSSYKLYRDHSEAQYVVKGLSRKPVITLSGMARLGKHVALTTENWIFPVRNEHRTYYPPKVEISHDYYYLLSYGLRFMGEKIAFDIGFLNNPDLYPTLVIGLPYGALTVKFGGKKMDDRDWKMSGKF
jgi:hypothetical protein